MFWARGGVLSAGEWRKTALLENTISSGALYLHVKRLFLWPCPAVKQLKWVPSLCSYPLLQHNHQPLVFWV